MTRRTAAVPALLVAGVMSLAGCRSGTQASPAAVHRSSAADFVDATGYRAALQRSFAAYRWPADFRPDLDVLADKSGPPAGARMSAGGERTVLEIVNRCAWYLSWDAARTRGGKAAAAAALRVMTDVLPAYGASDPDGQQLARDTARRATLGDPALARQYVRANCDTTKFVSS
jgi:hypothetical protein